MINYLYSAVISIETGTEPGSELVHIFVDGVVQIQTEAILKNAKKRCPQLFPRN